MTHDWYKIPEIDINDYIKTLESIYKCLEMKHTSKTTEDIFLKTILTSNDSELDWNSINIQRLRMKTLESSMGLFHERIMGLFGDYENLKQGCESGCDIRKRDGTEYYEIKNRHNTLNSSSAKSVVDKLDKISKSGKTAILVEINCKDDKVCRFKANPEIKVWNGKETYSYLSKRETFYNDLLETLEYTFKSYKTYESLKEIVK